MTGAAIKIFTLLIAIVVCVVAGAFLINILMPNAMQSMVSAVESGIYSATNLSLDLNGDNKYGKDNANMYSGESVKDNGTSGAMDNSDHKWQQNDVHGFTK